MNARRFVLALTVIGLAPVSLLIAADPPIAKKPADKPTTAAAAAAAPGSTAKPAVKQAAAKKRARLPQYYGRLGADAAQKEKLLAIVEQHADAIEQKRAELKALTDKREAELSAVLTAEQRQQLAKLRDEAKAKREATAKADSAPAAKSASEPTTKTEPKKA